ncbi:hypothetical protein IAE19_06945 [Acinetobacter sp. S40]|nr:hypothetical protein [Acinetobacter sp. S40]
MIAGFSSIYQIVLMKCDKQLTKFKLWKIFFNFVGKEYKSLIPKLLEYSRFDFHPHQSDERNLMAATKQKRGITDNTALFS